MAFSSQIVAEVRAVIVQACPFRHRRARHIFRFCAGTLKKWLKMRKRLKASWSLSPWEHGIDQPTSGDREAPLQSLFAAFLFGIWVARRR